MKYLTILFLFWIVLLVPLAGRSQDLSSRVRQAMLNSTRYMVEKVSANGGYVRLYKADLSRRWAELEAYETQIRVEEPGTVGMGNLFLDAYSTTGDEYYYQAATKVAAALSLGQLSEGGWNYNIDYGGDRSLKRWYSTIGKNAWGFEEHYKYYGNATFDDNVTFGAARYLLRMYLEKLDPAFKPALDKAINFILKSQYPLGAWPQRYPLVESHYSSYYTFNDDVTAGCLEFLLDSYVTLGYQHLLEPIQRAMNFYVISQQGKPQAGWAQQYNMNMQPASGRSYEPAALNTRQTVENIQMLFRFYRLTGDRKYLNGIPDAISWLESVRFPADQTGGGKRTHPFFVELVTNKALWLHREGNGIKDGKYWVDYNSEVPYAYGLNTKIDIADLQNTYQKLSAMSPEEVVKGSVLKAGKAETSQTLRNYLSARTTPKTSKPDVDAVNKVLSGLDPQHRWLSKHEWISLPYTVSASGAESNTAMMADSRTAAWISDSSEDEYISTAVYIQNMRLLLAYLGGSGEKATR